ncbi:hypothetical protein GKD50_11025 [Parabacteroides distasonis]|jgi:hypothetical protein|uniref:DUF6383 domain-containing protein n=1 Tax=Parabacteroides distasonis TaxID=823 RepID=UPI000EFB8918|nr:DUF6383 domain-containing protein [Parabacteroides distasonis]MRY63019.1 hypothetical protein [Parabacteroides distasonis]RGZ60593.1 hypothetical protein DW984_05730 [Parabacteroides distasonis]
MNKKFSTFLAGVALLSAMSANAQNLASAPVGADAAKVVKLDEAARKGVYQIRDDKGQALVIENGKYAFKTVSSLTDLKASLWCVKVTEEGSGKEPIYDFFNKATGETLAVSDLDASAIKAGTFATTDSLTVGESFGGWAFSSTYETTLLDNQPMYTYYEPDYVLLLTKGTNNGLQAKRVLAKDIRQDAKSKGAVELTLFNAGTYVLSASEINEYVKDNKFVLTFEKDANADVNPFSTTQFVAKGVADKKDSNTARNFVFVTSKEDANQYLKVDTAANGVGIQFLKFGWTDESKEPSKDVENSSLADQHKFLFTYRPSTDSLYIQVMQARYKNEKTPEKYWNQVTNIIDYGTTYHDIFCAGDEVGGPVGADSLFVKLQNFTVADRIATIGLKPINTHIKYNATNCFVQSDKTSKDNGLYIIKNAKGEVLAAPIHENDNVGNNTIEWVKLDEQQPLHMPAYQWVVTKTLSTATSLATSPITITNREFPNKKWNNVQLRLNDKGEIIASSSEFNNVTFDQIKDSTIIKDKKLGYKYLSNNELIVNKYKFNYLNPFTQDYWIANGADKDSLIYVKQDANEYILTEGSTAEYGIDVDATLLKKIPGLAQLERTNYVIAKNKTAKLVKAYGSKYSMGAANYGTVAEVDTFFFKENNHYDGKHYYAILETAYDNTKHAAYIADLNKETSKVGIADDGMTAGLKVQLLNESRTSAFTVEPSDAPLYRRFNKAVLGENVNDGADSLAFVERYRHEYLMDETNANFEDKNGVVDYLGIWNKDKANGKLAMRIDTAWLNRGAGNVKPQYLISVARDDQGAIETIPCDEADDKHFYIDENGNAHKTDKWHCQHAKPGRAGFAYGKYLVSFADSARADKDKPYMDIKNGYTRVGFVKAIHSGDSLYILVNEFKNMKPADLNIDEIIKSYKAAKIDGAYIVNLQGDQHKNVTWSFRYVDPDKAASVTEEGEANAFMFESNVYSDSPETSVNGNVPLGNVHGLENAIAPKYAAWLKMQNGCLVLTRGDSDFNSSKTGGDAALVFNVDPEASKGDMVTSNDEVAVEGVSVVAGNGTVTVQGAAGKSVVITNILGKVVAETVLTSDNATIAVPAGIVAVAVEGEEAVKTIVK